MTLWLTLDGGGLSELKSDGGLQKEDVQILPHKNFLIPNVKMLASIKKPKTNYLKKNVFTIFTSEERLISLHSL